MIGGGLLLIGGGTLGQAVLGAGSGWTALLAGLTVAGAGVGLVSPALGGAALESVPAHSAGMAGGSVNTARQLGYALGVAVFGTVLTSRMTDSLDGSTGAAHALAGGGAAALRPSIPDRVLHTAFAAGLNSALLLAGAVAVLAGIAVLLFLRTPSAAAVAETVRQPSVPVARP
jgi:hypothetical protein